MKTYPTMISRSSILTLPRLGIAISKLIFDVHLCLPDGRPHSAQFANNDEGFVQFEAWLVQHCATKTHVGIEATGPYGALLFWRLHTCGHNMHQFNSRRVKDYARSQGLRVKTNATDAALIAAYLNANEDLKPWQPASQALMDLQALVRRRS
ncbi:transposase [Prosthecobacter sp.]|uniref:IS110 family transposase n=1 Tax=Prosthecobacter sp. TaxID=1965333 RepID=UPI0037C8CAC6